MKLAFRPTKLKIKVGVIADAALGPFPEGMRPDSTWERNDNGPECMHPYKFMWNLIGAFYTDNQWNELSNERLDQKCNQIVTQGSSKLIKAEQYFQHFEICHCSTNYEVFETISKQKPLLLENKSKKLLKGGLSVVG